LISNFLILVIFILGDLGNGLYRYIIKERDHVNISIGAHLGGAITGLSLGLAILNNFDEKPWERVCKWVGVTLFITYSLFAIFWNVFWPEYPAWGDDDFIEGYCRSFSECDFADDYCTS